MLWRIRKIDGSGVVLLHSLTSRANPSLEQVGRQKRWLGRHDIVPESQPGNGQFHPSPHMAAIADSSSP
jgi:hypothetical protein